MYRAVLYDNGQVEVKPTDDSVSCDSVVGGIYAIRETPEEAIRALIAYVDNQRKEYLEKAKVFVEQIEALKSALPKKNKCWECKHWGTVDAWGIYTFDGHWHAVRKPKLSRAWCPCQQIKSGKRPRCMSAYADACDKFVRYSDAVNG